MPDPIITLTTDFGEDSPYVAAMKGVILSTNPAARIVDLSHLIPPQDVRQAAFFLAEAIPFFPPEVIHIVVVDPGVGTERAVLFARVGAFQLLVPDNGVISLLATRRGVKCRLVTNTRLWRSPVSATFHGRDIFAPVASFLSLGAYWDRASGSWNHLVGDLLGPETEKWVKLSFPTPEIKFDGVYGEVLFVDHFGNLLTNLPADRLPSKPFRLGINVFPDLPAREVPVRPVATYGEAKPGELVALISSGGFWEFAVVNGNASRRFGVQRGTRLQVINAA